MNAIFTAIFLASSIAVCLCAPNAFLPSLLNGTMNAANTGLTMFCIYSVWMGISAVAEDAGINRGISKFLQPACRKIFKCEDGAASENIAMNLSCNLLGIGGAATPFAVKAVNELEKSGNTFAQNLLFIVNSTSIQIIPTTVIALRAAAGSANASDVTLPSILATAVSTGLAVTVYLILNKLWHL